LEQAKVSQGEKRCKQMMENNMPENKTASEQKQTKTMMLISKGH